MESMWKSQIIQSKQNRLLEHFVARTTARIAARLAGVHRNTSAFYFYRLREIITLELEAEGEAMFGGEIKVDESYFGARRVKGKRGRGAYGKTTVFGIFEREGQVYTEIVPDCSKSTLQGIIRGRVDAHNVINSDGWRGYNGLVDLGYGHFRVERSKDEFARGRVHINGIEGFGEDGESAADKVQRIAKTHLPSSSQGNRMAL